MTTVISVENLSKTYHLGQIGTGTFSRDLDLWWAKLRGKPNPLLRIGEKEHGNRDGEELWALRDISFTVEQGEVLGIIGRNGAGKSTLLKILSRVTAPTSGRIKVKGRIASLLEVGTGFHPELTGRENIYLNGAILGMSRKEIDNKFDEIVDFSGVEKFVDTPVKRYSSGMYVRLAFAVAAHLEPEILLVDEVLAVGDAEFQKKCLGKMGKVASEGRTVLFVSHNMAAITQLCNRAVLFENGSILEDANSFEVATKYLKRYMSPQTNIDTIHRVGSGRARFISVKILDDSGQELTTFRMGQSLFVEMDVMSDIKSGMQLAVVVSDHFGKTLIHAVDQDDKFIPRATLGHYCVRVKFPDLALYPGQYMLGVWCGYEREDYDYIREYARFSVEQGIVSGRVTKMVEGQAVFFSPTKWENL